MKTLDVKKITEAIRTWAVQVNTQKTTWPA